ncbi:MAG: DnaD domain protein [Christensenellales bacterium]|jgi:DNA replication protein DnaD
MPFLSFADDAAMYDSTSFDNMFLIEYLPLAPEAYLKVYLYARMLMLHPEMGGLEELSRALRLPEEDIFMAFSYWERMGLVERATDNPPTYRFLPVRACADTVMDRDYYKYRDFNAELQSLFGSEMMHPAQYAIANDWLNVLGFTQDAALALIKRELARSRAKKPDPARIFKAADKRAAQLADMGVTTAEGVERAFARDERVENAAQSLLRQFGLRRRPTDPEIALAAKWLDEWKYTTDDIRAACQETVKAQNPSFAYIDAILSNRRSETGAFAAMKRVLSHLGARNQPTPEQVKWYDERLGEGFEPETIALAAAQQARKNNNSFEGLDFLIGLWRERGLLARAQAEEYVSKNRTLLNDFTAILRAAGIERRPTEEDVAAFDEWRQALPAEVIAHAAESARGKRYPISYMRSLIDGWRAAGAQTLAAVQALGDKVAPQQAAKARNPALDYEQRQYRDEDFDDSYYIETARKLMDGGDAG